MDLSIHTVVLYVNIILSTSNNILIFYRLLLLLFLQYAVLMKPTTHALAMCHLHVVRGNVVVQIHSVSVLLYWLLQ